MGAVTLIMIVAIVGLCIYVFLAERRARRIGKKVNQSMKVNDMLLMAIDLWRTETPLLHVAKLDSIISSLAAGCKDEDKIISESLDNLRRIFQAGGGYNQNISWDDKIRIAHKALEIKSRIKDHAHTEAKNNNKCRK